MFPKIPEVQSQIEAFSGVGVPDDAPVEHRFSLLSCGVPFTIISRVGQPGLRLHMVPGFFSIRVSVGCGPPWQFVDDSSQAPGSRRLIRNLSGPNVRHVNAAVVFCEEFRAWDTLSLVGVAKALC